MRRFLAVVVVFLGAVSVTHGIVYAQKAESCWFMRLTQDERPECCSLVGKTRFTPVGGDCCKLFLWDDAEPGATTDVPTSVPVALLVELPRLALVHHEPTSRGPAIGRARAPPPWRPTDTIRLLI